MNDRALYHCSSKLPIDTVPRPIISVMYLQRVRTNTLMKRVLTCNESERTLSSLR